MRITVFVLLCFFHHCFSQPIIPCCINSQIKHKGVVAACMMFQNEGRFLREWLEYHKSIGVTHFYLYNNASTDNYWEVLMPYVVTGQVELFDLFEKTENCTEHNALQRQAYTHAVQKAAEKYQWLAIIDSDEFICMPHSSHLGNFLEQYLYATGLVINWVMYGSSYIEELGLFDLQIDRFRYRAPDDWGENFLFKTIVRPKYVLKADIHLCKTHPDMLVHPNHMKFSHCPQFLSPPIDKIRLNHYWWRDEKYFREIKRLRRLGWLSHYTDEEIDARRQVYNSVYDDSMAPFVEAMRNIFFKLQ